jgi:pimeloyl-ACP methyl ester carboxylesterase
MSIFLLVHGGEHGAWCWAKLIPELRAGGHEALAVDLPGHGADPTPPEQVTFDDYVSVVIAALERLEETPVLVGHSLAGMVISAVAERVPEKLRRLVYLAAHLPNDGDSMLLLEARNPQPCVTRHLRLVRGGAAVVVARDRVRKLFYADCADEDAAEAIARLRPEPTAPLGSALRLTAGRFGRVPRVFVTTAQDRAIPLVFQRQMIAGSPPTPTRALRSGHSPFLSMPRRLAGVLAEAGGTTFQRRIYHGAG